MNTNFDVRKETQKERTYTLDGLINEERLISSLANGWAYIQGGGGGEGFKVVFYGTCTSDSL